MSWPYALGLILGAALALGVIWFIADSLLDAILGDQQFIAPQVQDNVVDLAQRRKELMAAVQIGGRHE